jgi:hypothetical protein
MNCSHCQHEFTSLRSASRTPKALIAGSILLCPKCGLLSITEIEKRSDLSFNPMTTRPITEIEWAELHPATQDDLRFAIRCIIDNARRQGLDQIITLPFVDPPTRSNSEPNDSNATNP